MRQSTPMRKISAFLFILLGCGLYSAAQVRVAILAGGHQSTVIEENELPNWNDIKNNYTGRIGFHTGFVADIAFSPKSKLFFQPGVIYYNRGRKFAQSFDPPVGTIVRQQSTQYINYIASSRARSRSDGRCVPKGKRPSQTNCVMRPSIDETMSPRSGRHSPKSLTRAPARRRRPVTMCTSHFVLTDGGPVSMNWTCQRHDHTRDTARQAAI